MGRPALTEEQIRERVLAYCQRYHVSPRPEGLPPFPTGRRETRQHREWLAVYRALQRARARAAATDPGETLSGASCPVCARLVGPQEGVAWAGPRGRSRRLHPGCADLARLAQSAGPDALARLNALLWPRRGRGAAS
jgi:hypothetical protein